MSGKQGDDFALAKLAGVQCDDTLREAQVLYDKMETTPSASSGQKRPANGSWWEDRAPNKVCVTSGA